MPAAPCWAHRAGRTVLGAPCWAKTPIDMAAYDSYFSGKLQDYSYPREKVQEALRHLPKVSV